MVSSLKFKAYVNTGFLNAPYPLNVSKEKSGAKASDFAMPN
jgi:hypothetical protein